MQYHIVKVYTENVFGPGRLSDFAQRYMAAFLPTVALIWVWLVTAECFWDCEEAWL